MHHLRYLFFTGPPGPPAGVYVQDLTVTSYSARLVWTVGQDTDHGDAITSFDVEAETNYHPGDWQILASGLRFTLVLCLPINIYIFEK